MHGVLGGGRGGEVHFDIGIIRVQILNQQIAGSKLCVLEITARRNGGLQADAVNMDDAADIGDVRVLRQITHFGALDGDGGVYGLLRQEGFCQIAEVNVDVGG